MESSARFCETCGQPLTAQAKFCGFCGQPVKPLPARPPASTLPTGASPSPRGTVPGGYPPSPLPTQPQGQYIPPQPAQPVQGEVYPAQQPQQGFYPPQPPTQAPQTGVYPPSQPQGGFYPPQADDPFAPLPQAPQGEFYPAQPPQGYAYPQQPAYPQEQVCGVIAGASRKKGFMGMSADNYVLVVTNQRILFATQSKEIMQQQIEQARQAAKAQGKNFLSQWGAQLTANNGQRYLQMDPQTVLAEHPENFFYLQTQIRSVRFSRYNDDETNRTDYTIELDTVAGKVKLNFSVLNEHEAKNLLRNTLGNIVR